MILLVAVALLQGYYDSGPIWQRFERRETDSIDAACADIEPTCLPPMRRELNRAVAKLKSIADARGEDAAEAVRARCEVRNQVDGAIETARYHTCIASASLPPGPSRVAAPPFGRLPRPLTAAEKSAVLAQMDGYLSDAATARYKWPLRQQEGSYCVWVNARNAYGGYTGFRPVAVFVATPPKEPPRAIILPVPDDLARSSCGKDGYRMP